MSNLPENKSPEDQIFNALLENALRAGYNVSDPKASHRWLRTLREEDDEPALLTPVLESQINTGAFGPRIKTMYLRFLEFCEESLSVEQKDFLQNNRQLLY